MITHYIARKGGEQGMAVIDSPIDGAWTHVVAPTSDDFMYLISHFGLEESIVNDIKDDYEIPRFEQDGTITYFFTRFINGNEHIDTETSPLLIVLGASFIVTIANHEVPFLNSFVDGNRQFLTKNRTHFFLEIMMAIAADYSKALNVVRKSVYRDVNRVRNISGRDIQRLVYFEQELNEILSTLLPTNAWLQQLTKGNYIQMFEDDRELLDDVLISGTQIVDTTKAILKTIQNIRSASEAVLTQKLNGTIRMLTAFTIILTIPTLIASLFGMNVPVPLQENPYGFWFVLIFIAGVVTVTIRFFVHNRWL
ncbi:MAG TPA: magnesium transporter CorA family protein [Candidatus Paceibacterota bacterium]|nr:magnesium transporter CorA family protein [Candidatus Paceibacterota bacterium]